LEPVQSGNCLVFTELGAQGNGWCPPTATGFSNGYLLSNGMPAGGATVTDLYAETNAMLSGSSSALVAVIDNTSGATLLSCTVNSTNRSSCSNSSGSGSAATGDKIEVKVTTNGYGANNKQWQVKFRY